ncbi:MAG: phosphoribosylformylglycinamidine cyclo-ligase, partial [Thermoguttaceae bacterium]|nr:phosphoribosylformylglycinamidine cyclo-ligase [Thermoguttaceae bacterium]
TGGGLVENLCRVLPDTCAASFDADAIAPTPLFNWVQRLGNIDDDEMRRVFNMGIGLVLAVREDAAGDVAAFLNELGEEARVIGQVRAK